MLKKNMPIIDEFSMYMVKWLVYSRYKKFEESFYIHFGLSAKISI